MPGCGQIKGDIRWVKLCSRNGCVGVAKKNLCIRWGQVAQPKKMPGCGQIKRNQMKLSCTAEKVAECGHTNGALEMPGCDPSIRGIR